MSTLGTVTVSNYQRPIDLIDFANRDKTKGSNDKVKGESFKTMFSQELAGQQGISFSKHAHQRMYSRGIELTEENLNALAGAIDKASGKGSKDTLILSDQAAFVVDVKDRMVITVFDRDNLSDGVVTSIDSAVII